jgi:hypothetical protein
MDQGYPKFAAAADTDYNLFRARPLIMKVAKYRMIRQIFATSENVCDIVMLPKA